MKVLRLERLESIKDELKMLGLLLVISIVGFQIVFYKEGFLSTLRFVLSLFWIFVLPGFTLMYYWSDKIDFAQRLIAGVAVSAGVIGIASYYIGLLGLDIRYHSVLLPLIMLSVGLFINLRQRKAVLSEKHPSEHESK